MPAKKDATDPLSAAGLPPPPDREAMKKAQEATGATLPDAALVEVYTRDIERIMLGVNDVMSRQTQESGKHAEHQYAMQELRSRLDRLEQELMALSQRVEGISAGLHGH